MIPSLVNLACSVLGKHFLSIESFRYIPYEIVESIFEEYIKSISSLSIINENDLLRIVNLLTDYHSDVFCTSFCYYTTNSLNFLTANFYLQLFQRVHLNLLQLDLSNAFEKFNHEEKRHFLNVIGQMEHIEYLRLTFNRLDDEDIRLLTASNRIKSRAMCNLQSLHLQGNDLTHRSARFLKALTSLETLYISFFSPRDKASFVREFDNLHECTCSTQHHWEEIVNRGWIAKIPHLQSSSTTTIDSYFYRKRRRVDHDDSTLLIKLVRFCSSCHPLPSAKTVKKKEEILSNPKAFIDSRQANDLLSCYL